VKKRVKTVLDNHKMDIRLFRKTGGTIDALKESQRRRGRPESEIDEVTRLDEEWAAGMISF
jgi:hypothetical protein